MNDGELAELDQTAFHLVTIADGQAARYEVHFLARPVAGGEGKPVMLAADAAAAQRPGRPGPCAGVGQAPGTTVTVAEVVLAKGPPTTSTVMVCSPGGSGRSITAVG